MDTTPRSFHDIHAAAIRRAHQLHREAINGWIDDGLDALRALARRVTRRLPQRRSDALQVEA